MAIISKHQKKRLGHEGRGLLQIHSGSLFMLFKHKIECSQLKNRRKHLSLWYLRFL